MELCFSKQARANPESQKSLTSLSGKQQFLYCGPQAGSRLRNHIKSTSCMEHKARRAFLSRHPCPHPCKAPSGTPNRSRLKLWCRELPSSACRHWCICCICV